MSPKEKLEFNKMQNDIKNIKSVSDAAFIAELNRRLGGLSLTAVDGASTSGTTVTVRDAAGTGTEVVAEQYGGVLTLTDNQGNAYRIGYYT